MGSERAEAFLDEVAEQPDVSEVMPGVAPERGEKPDYRNNVVDIETGKASARVSRLAAQRDMEDAEETGRVRSSLERVKDRVSAQLEDERAIEELTPPARIERMAAQAVKREKIEVKDKRKSAWKSFWDTFKPGRPN